MAFESGLRALPRRLRSRRFKTSDSLNDADFADTEHSIGIAIDPASGTAGQGEAAGKIYSAHYLRLRDAWQLGVCAAAEDKDFNHQQHGRDLVKALLNGGQHQIIVGGQQRICSARVAAAPLPLPARKGRPTSTSRTASFCEMDSPQPRGMAGHCGRRHTQASTPTPAAGCRTGFTLRPGSALLKAGDTTRHEQDSRGAWRQRVRQQDQHLRQARRRDHSQAAGRHRMGSARREWRDRTRAAGGAQSTHLAVPAGAVYYFEADSAEEARKLAAALNWHGGESNPTTSRTAAAHSWAKRASAWASAAPGNSSRTSPDVPANDSNRPNNV